MTDRLSLVQKAALLTGRTVWQTWAMPTIGLRSIWLADGPHGVRRQAGSADHLGLHQSLPATCFPTSATVANSWDLALAEEIGQALGAEARAQGVDVLLGPGLNIKRSPLGGRNFEYFSEDPWLSGQMAAAYIRGIQSRGVAACPKHFAVNSQELRRMESDAVVDQRALRELYLTGFEIAVREGRPKVLMSSYNRVNGVYASEHPQLLGQILRQEWGFDGVVVTDWGGSNDIVAAVAAGGTLEMPAAGHASTRQLVAAVGSGQLSEADLDTRVQELIRLVRSAPDPEPAPAVDFEAHHRLARRAAAASAVLLKNQAGLLPLPAGTAVAVVGDFARRPRYQGAGSSTVNPVELENLLDAMADSELNLTGFAAGFRRDGRPDPRLRDEAVALAGTAEVVLVCLGLDEVSESEGLDRRTLALPAAQIETLQALAQTNPCVVVLVCGGGVVETDWLEHCQALIHAYLPGQAGASGLLDVLTGRVDPSGRLTETMPLRLADTPTAGRFPAPGATAEHRESLYVGYRYYNTIGAEVAFPFGYGLSYTTFDYSELTATADQVRLTVRNSGQRDGAEVVQVYLERRSPGLWRPRRELKGFARVELAAGQAETVQVALGPMAFRHFDPATESWQVEQGRWAVLVGASVEDIRLEAEVEVAGTTPPVEPDPALPSYQTGHIEQVTAAEFAALLGRRLPPVERTGPLGPSDTLGQMDRAASRLARLVRRVLNWRLKRSLGRGKPSLNLLFIHDLPFRALPKMTGGVLDAATVDGLLRIVNGSFWSGLRQTLGAFLRNHRANRLTAAELDQS
ncbi:MAG: glycoside hydrolase family 3 C-terminal domain-containing protein [Propionibacteriaceae bacterium]|jgi:beta-glucosidase|nr:glycoside hydrolase family 3 C-terminal domain-containing protein [Propionibacteriaceae bacterium]